MIRVAGNTSVRGTAKGSSTDSRGRYSYSGEPGTVRSPGYTPTLWDREFGSTQSITSNEPPRRARGTTLDKTVVSDPLVAQEWWSCNRSNSSTVATEYSPPLQPRPFASFCDNLVHPPTVKTLRCSRFIDGPSPERSPVTALVLHWCAEMRPTFA
jgi:hypothetical protein